MVYVVSRWWYPSHVGDEVTKKYQKFLKEGPPEGFVSGVGEVAVTGAFTGSKDGFVGMAFTKATPENVGQVMMNSFLILQRYAEIEGYEFNVEVWGDITEIPG